MKNIHYLFYITSKNFFSQFCFEHAVSGAAVHHCTLNCTVAGYLFTLRSHAFNGLSILYHVTPYHPIKRQESKLVYIKRNK